MKRTNKIIKAVLVAGMATMMLMSCGAQGAESNCSQPHFSSEAPREAQEIFRMFKGSVSTVDPKVMTLIIKLEEKEHTFKGDFKNQIRNSKKPCKIN